LGARRLKGGSIGLGQSLPMLEIDEQRDLSATFPPAGIVIVLGHLVQPELLVVVRTDPLGGIDCAASERWINVGGGNLQWHNAVLRQNTPPYPANAELEPFEVVDGVDPLAIEAAHLHAHIAAGNGQNTVLLEQCAEELQPSAVIHPGLLLARVEPEREPGIERDRRVLADIESGKLIAA